MHEIDESEVKSKFHELCRLCASYDNVKIGLFSDEGRRRQLRKKIQTCLPFKVDESDGFPKSLCFKCVYNLETTYEFRCKCIQVNRNLEKHLYKTEKDNQSKNVVSIRSHRIHPEVSIFAISAETSEDKHNNEERSTSMECEEEPPNPLDFLEVGVNSEDNSIRPKQNFQESKKQPYAWKADRRWLSVEHKPLPNDSTNDETAAAKVNMKYFDTSTQDDNASRRKSCKPRRIARDTEDAPSCAQPNDPNRGRKSANRVTPTNAKENGSAAPETEPEIQEHDTKEAVSVADEGNDEAHEQSFTCLLCEKNFNQRSALNKHFSSVHGIEPYEVLSQAPVAASQAMPKPYVGGDDKHDEDLENMMEQETVIFCEVCRREFQDRASLWLHMVHAHREEASVSCGICLKICCDNITLIEHVNTAHSGDKAVVQRRYSCQVCGRQHDSRQKLLKHATLHTLIDNQGQTIQPEEMVSLNNAFAPRECPVCHKKFFNEDKLNHHTQNFHNDTNDTTLSPSTVYKCELCASAHATRMDRWWHMYYSHNGDARVTCELSDCRKIFVSCSLKDEHAKSHHQTQGNFTNTCEICGKLWESRTVFYKHMMNVHPKCLPTICGICMKIFSNVPELRHHVTSDHPPLEQSGGICCDVCGRPYAERSKMLRHRRVHNVTDGVPTATSTVKKKDDLVCSFCPEISFEKYEDIAQHRRNVHQLFVCDLCPKFYNGNNHLWKHVSKQHKGDPNVTCNLCLRTSASRAHLERHKIKYHSDPVDRLMSRQNSASNASGGVATLSGVDGLTAHKCNLCGKLFRIRSLLKKHLKSCKGAKPTFAKVTPVNGVFPCSKCQKVFEQQSVLSKHMKNSHMQHACEVCQLEAKAVAFDTKKALLQHIRELHYDNNELACDVEGCGKVLRLKADLKKHKLEHQRGYFTYICEICGDMFSNRKKLRKHLLTYHKNDVKFLCAICATIHQSHDELTRHVHGAHAFVLHRPYTCQICGKSWSVSSKVVEHISKVHGAEYKPCKICWKVFTDEETYNEHVNNHPPIEEKPATATPPQQVVAADDDEDSQLSPPLSGDADETRSLKRPRDDEETSCDEESNAGKRLRRKYKCIWCQDTFRSMDELKEHKISNHGALSNEAVAPETPNRDDELEDTSAADSAAAALAKQQPHDSNKFERWTDIRPIACDCCDKIWNSKKQLWQHLIRSHAYESQHTCGICLQVCRDYFDLFYHLDSQHSEIVNDSANRFSCFVCGHYHNSQSKLDKHFLLHKNAPARCEYTCQYCRKVYKSVAFYRDHVRVHEAAMPPAESKAKPISEFSGFSINHILATKDDRSRNLTMPVVKFEPECQRPFNEGVYDLKYQQQQSIDETAEDLVEEMDEDDDDSDNEASKSSLFDATLEKCKEFAKGPENVIMNGGASSEFAPAFVAAAVNNNQKHASKFQTDKNFRNSSGDDFYRVTEDV